MRNNQTSKLLLAAVVGLALLALSHAAIAGPLNEGFEGTYPPDGWLVVNNDGGSNQWSQTSVYAHTGTYSTRCRYETSSLANDDWLITPKLSVVANDTLTFWYRTYSASYQETVEVRLSTTTSSLDQFTNVLWATQVATSTWTEMKFDLTAFAGQEVFIAFVYKSLYEWYWYIDDVTGPDIVVAGDDMATQTIDNPGDGDNLEGNSSVSVQATVKNTGANAQSGVAVNLEIDDGGGYTYTDVEYTGSLNPDDTEQITFDPDWTVPNSSASYTVKVWTALGGDGNADNDTVTISVSASPEGYTVESFENSTFPPEGWALGPNTNWARTSGSAHSGSYKARARGQDAWLMTPQLAVGAGDVLKYWYRSESASYATSFYVRLSTSSDQSDTGSYTTLLADHSMITNTTYTEGVIDLSPYAAHLKKGQVYIAFHRYYGASDYWYLYLDDVMMPPIYVPPGDMATISIDDLPDFVQTGTSTAIKATVQNLGGDLASAGVPVKLRIEGPESYVYTDEEATTVDLATDETEQITFAPDWVAPEVLCNYTVTIWTELGGDAATDNDTLSQVVTVYRAGGLAESFTGTTFPPPGWTVYAFDGGDQWSRYTTYYHSDPACARIYYDSPNNDWLITPRLAAQDGDKLKFWWRVQSTSYEETVFVRVSTDPDVSDTSAYSIIHTIISNSTSWSLETVDLSSYAGQSIYIAWTYDNYNNYGFAIDDVTGPYFPTQIAVSPTDFDWESFPDSFFDVYMYVGNVGGGQLDYSIELETAVGWLSVNPTSGSALGGEEDTLTVSVNTTGLDGHYYNTIRVISNSGEKQDGDTVFVPVHLWVRLIPDIDIDPDSFAVEVPGDGTLDDNMYIHSTGSGQLDYEIDTEEYGKVDATFMGQRAHHDPSQRLSKPSTKEPEKDQRDFNRGVPPTKGLGGPDAFGYKWIDSDEPGGPSYSWVEINSTGTQLDLTDDDNDGPYPIGFTFNYYGVDFTEFYVCSNGWISFVDATTTSLTNDPIPDASSPYGPLALFWDDLRPATGGGAGYVYYEYDGLNRLIIEYDGVMRYACDTCLYTMEMILYANGQIFYQYDEMTGHRTDESTIGIESPDDTDGLEVVYNAEYVHDNLAIRFSAAPAWIVYDPESGSVPPGETDTIDVTFDATGILGGDFFGAFLVSSNAEKSLDTIPAHMTVLAPDMTVSPDSIVSTGTEGAVHHEFVTLGNTGPGDLNWSIDETIDWLSASPSSGTVPSGGGPTAVDLTIDCTSLYAGDYYGELTIN
ncbi:MAG: choice-of-anchor J domain-containing protein, partial [Candidatus Zixiibacteriota bacterium]